MKICPQTFVAMLEGKLTSLPNDLWNTIGPNRLDDAHYWDWAASNAGIVSGIASGFASGIAAYLVFRLGQKAERDKMERQAKTVQAGAAFSALIKARDWMECGAKTASLAAEQIEARKQSIDAGTPKSLCVFPYVDSLIKPERLSIHEIAFLATLGQADLINDILEIQNWGHHMLQLSKTFTNERNDFDAWALTTNSNHTAEENGVTSTGISVVSEFSGNDAIQARIKTSKMDVIVDAIIEGHVDAIKRHQCTIEKYVKECNSEFSKQFPVSIKF